MEAPLIVVTDTPDASALGAIRAALDRFNETASGISDQQPLAVLVKAPLTHEVIGGLTGRTSRGVLFVDVFFLPESLRGRGLGREVLQRAENEARDRGCRTAVLHTNTFQAPGFYKRLGWRQFGAIDCDPPGTQRIFFSKNLRRGD